MQLEILRIRITQVQRTNAALIYLSIALQARPYIRPPRFTTCFVIASVDPYKPKPTQALDRCVTQLGRLFRRDLSVNNAMAERYKLN
jgi:hypothetical protein